MVAQPVASQEDQLFDALREVFEMNDTDALEISKRAACLIANYVADQGALSKGGVFVSEALARIAEMQNELDQLSQHLREFSTVIEPAEPAILH